MYACIPTIYLAVVNNAESKTYVCLDVTCQFQRLELRLREGRKISPLHTLLPLAKLMHISIPSNVTARPRLHLPLRIMMSSEVNPTNPKCISLGSIDVIRDNQTRIVLGGSARKCLTAYN